MWQQSSVNHADEDSILADDDAMTWKQARALSDIMEQSHHINLDCSCQDQKEKCFFVKPLCL